MDDFQVMQISLPVLEQDSSAVQIDMFGPIENRPYHEAFMREAINMAELALKTDETPVGCVFVHSASATIIGRGMNDTNRSMNGTRHAEFVAIEQILAENPASIFRETDLYVTVEPCIMCASALRQYGIRTVYYGCANDKFGGTGGVMNIHSDWSVQPSFPAYGGLFREEAIMLLRRFYVQENAKAPEPHRKGTRELKTEILPVVSPSPQALTGKTNQVAVALPRSLEDKSVKRPSRPLGPLQPALPRSMMSPSTSESHTTQHSG